MFVYHYCAVSNIFLYPILHFIDKTYIGWQYTIKTTFIGDISGLNCQYLLAARQLSIYSVLLMHTIQYPGGIFPLRSWDPFHQWFMSSQFKSRKNSFGFYFEYKDLIRSHFCTCHDSSAVMTCAKLWPDCITVLHERTWFLLWDLVYELQKPLVRWFPGLLQGDNESSLPGKQDYFIWNMKT